MVAELGWRARATSRALEFDPPAWLTGLLGEVPDTGRGRRAWRQTAARLHSYRHSYQLSDPDRPLGGEPTSNLTQQPGGLGSAEQAGFHFSPAEDAAGDQAVEADPGLVEGVVAAALGALATAASSCTRAAGP